jgi:hypothetical protein
MEEYMEHIALGPDEIIPAHADTLSSPVSDGLLGQIYAQLGEASANEVVLERSWMRLGEMLRRCKEGGEWRAHFPSFEHFMLDLRTRYNRGKTQLWAYLTVAEKLLPTIPAETLEEIGISKAMELKRAMAKSGKPVPQNVLDVARQQKTTIKELRALLGETFNIDNGAERGSWFDFDGCYFTAEERKEFVACILISKAALGLTNDIPEHIQRKEIFLNWAREFVGTHAADVYAPGERINTPATLMLPGKS